MARRPGGPYRLRAISTTLRCPTTSRPSRIQPERRSSRRRPLASSTATARARPRLAGSRRTRRVPARRASAARRPSRSPTRLPATAGSRPSGMSITSRSTVRAASSAPARASDSSRSTGVRTTSHSGRTPRATASTGSKARARSSHATIAPPACASATVRSATVVRPEVAAPRSATVAVRGRPPVPRMASSAANPVGTMRPSASGAGCPGRRTTTGARGVGARGSGSSLTGTSTGPGRAIGARARAPSVGCARAPPELPLRFVPRSAPRRGAAAPQRAWRAASASETSDVRAIGRPTIERMFTVVKRRTAARCAARVTDPGGGAHPRTTARRASSGTFASARSHRPTIATARRDPRQRLEQRPEPRRTRPAAPRGASRESGHGPRRNDADRVVHSPAGPPDLSGVAPWGCSSAGRAPRSHRGGQGFESPHLHHSWVGRAGGEPKGL